MGWGGTEAVKSGTSSNALGGGGTDRTVNQTTTAFPGSAENGAVTRVGASGTTRSAVPSSLFTVARRTRTETPS